MQQMVTPTTNHSHEMISTADEKEHLANCVVEHNPTSQILIPCEMCGQLIDFETYDEHLNEHKAKLKQIEEEKAAVCTVPCEVCKFPILFSEYEAHIKVHDKIPEQKVEDEQTVGPSTIQDMNKTTFPTIKPRFTTRSTGNVIIGYTIDSLSNDIICEKGDLAKFSEIFQRLHLHAFKIEKNKGFVVLKIRS